MCPVKIFPLASLCLMHALLSVGTEADHPAQLTSPRSVPCADSSSKFMIHAHLCLSIRPQCFVSKKGNLKRSEGVLVLTCPPASATKERTGYAQNLPTVKVNNQKGLVDGWLLRDLISPAFFPGAVRMPDSGSTCLVRPSPPENFASGWCNSRI